MYNKKILFVLLKLLLIPSCYSPIIFNLKTEETETSYFKGVQVISKEIEGIKVELNFEEHSGNEFLFYLYVKNKSNDTIRFIPSVIFAELYYNTQTSPNAEVYALNPELEIVKTELRMKSRQKQHEVSSGLNTVFGLVSVVTDIAVSPKETVVSNVADDLDRWAYNQTNENINFQNRMHNLETNKKFWQNETIRKTTLFPGEEIGGLLLIPVNPATKNLEIYIPIEEQKFSFKFKQIRKFN